MKTQNSLSPVYTGEIKLYPHQVEALWRMPEMEKNGKGGVLAFCPGLGKTITMISHLKHMKRDEMSGGCDLIVCPVSVISHWVKEILSIYSDSDSEKKPSILVYHGSKRDPRVVSKNWDYIITTYDILKSTEGGGSYEIKKRFTRMIIDEAHNIKNGSRKKCPALATAAFEFSKKSKFKWCITGTPFNNSIMDLASLAMFIGMEGYTNPEDWKCGNIDVSEWCDKHVILMRKDGLLKEPLYHDLIVTPSTKEAQLIEALRDVAGKQYEAWMEAEGKDRIKEQGTLLALLTKMRQCSDSYYVIGEKYKNTSATQLYKKSAKVKETLRIIDEKLYGVDQDPCRGIVIFSQFTRYLKLLKKVIKTRLPYVDIYVYTGTTSKDERDQVVKDFTKDIRPRVLLISLFAGGVGLNLNPCSSILLSEPWYNPFIEQQAEDRVHRLGQEYQVNVFRLTMDNSVEKWMQGIKMSKLAKAADIGLIESVPKNGMGGISSTFKMEDLSSLFNEYVGLKKNGKLINPKSAQNENIDFTTDEFTIIMNNWFGKDMWEVDKNPKSNKEYLYGGGCINTTMTLDDFYEFAEDCNMTYINNINRKKDPDCFGVYMRILPGSRSNVQIWYTIKDGKSREIKSRFKNRDWKSVNTYLMNMYK